MIGMKYVTNMVWASSVAMMSVFGTVSAQNQVPQEEAIEEIFVTGSLIRRSSFEGPSPVQQITTEDIELQGAAAIIDVVKNLAINSGSQFNQYNVQFGTGAGAQSQFNLRGLGLNATLTLIDGRRMAPSAVTGNGGQQFVNINQIPASMIERIDILKTGASATYGSEAVAGVVNIITRKDFNGFELNLDYRDSNSVPWGEYSVAAIGGASTDRTRGTVGLEFKDRDPLYTRDLVTAGGDFWLRTGFGQPSAFASAMGGPPRQDPLCGDPSLGLGLSRDENGPGNPGGLCALNLAPFFTNLPDDERLTGWGNFEVDLSDSLQAYGQVGYSRQRVATTGSPTFPLVNYTVRPIVPGSHPDFPAGLAAVLPRGVAQDVFWLGRPIGTNASDVGLANGRSSPRELDNYLAVIGLRGDWETAAGRRWDWNFDVVGSLNDNANRSSTVSKSRLQASLDRCRDPSDPHYNDTAPGCWNPFGNAWNGTGTPNSTEVLDYFIDNSWNFSRSEMVSIDGSATGGLMDLPGGELRLAVGFQHRKEGWDNDPTQIVNINDGAFGSQNFDVSSNRTVDAFFAELAVPFERAELQLAVRQEDYSDTGSSTDPKIALAWDATDVLTFRGSWSTAFRAPQLNQLSGVTTGLTQLSNPANGNRTVRPVVTESGDLTAEDAEALSLGAVVDLDRFSFGLDVWDYSYTDLITQQDAQRIINQVCTTSGCDPTHPLVDQVEIDPSGIITRVFRRRINAASLETSGIDLFGSWGADGGWGSYDLNWEMTWLNSYDIQEEAGDEVIDAVGSQNLTNLAPTLPEYRLNVTNIWSRDDHRVVVVLRQVAGITDDQFDTDVPEIASRFTVDAQYAYKFAGWGAGTSLSVGVINLLGDDVPFADNETSYVPDRDDPRGQQVYVTLRQSF